MTHPNEFCVDERKVRRALDKHWQAGRYMFSVQDICEMAGLERQPFSGEFSTRDVYHVTWILKDHHCHRRMVKIGGKPVRRWFFGAHDPSTYKPRH